MKIELHCHSGETSICGKVEAKELVRLHKEAGYDAVVVTDHYNEENVEQFTGTAEEKITQWLQGYESMKAEGEKAGLRVFFGIEARLPDCDNDYLLFGASPSFLYENPELHHMTLPDFYELCEKEGVLIIQAHPFRPGCHLADLSYLHGIEVCNGNPRHNSHNDLAQEIAAEHPELICTAGSDFHQVMDIDRCPVYMEDAGSEKELAEQLKKKNVNFEQIV